MATRTRILVINDTQAILELFHSILEEEGYEVMLSAVPYQNVSEIEQVHADLIILDIMFGDQKAGWQMVQMLRMNRATASLPIIVCTAAIREVRETEGYLIAQGVLVLYKPFKLDDLLSMVSQALALPHHVVSQASEEDEKSVKKKD
nr:response regulator [Ktedonobacteraceae bacterium]